MSLSFEVLARDGGARRGRIGTGHGAIETPAFMPVGTLGAVKGITPDNLESIGAEIMLSNLYHLAVRPGIQTISGLGGLHAFTGWCRPLLTDSGGFQVMSLAALRKVDEDGVTFRNHVDGGALRFTAESVVAMQRALGVDIAMALDECPPWPAESAAVAAATERTWRWAERARDAWESTANRVSASASLFGIVQGGVFRDQRERAAARIGELGFDGHAIGGVSVGEPAPERRAVVEWTAPLLPADRPRYLMGVGTPADLAHAVSHGIDLFDCVLPSRNARHGLLFTRTGALKIRNARYRNDERPLDSECACSTCQRTSRALLHHLLRSGEVTAAVLATVHNLRYYLDLMADLRQAIVSGSLPALQAEIARREASINAPEAPDVERPLAIDSPSL